MKYLRATLFMFATIAIYLGFALLGWGYDDRVHAKVVRGVRIPRCEPGPHQGMRPPRQELADMFCVHTDDLGGYFSVSQPSGD